MDDLRPRDGEYIITGTGEYPDKKEESAVALSDGVIKPDDCCPHCEGGWCKDGKVALTCEHALWPDNTDDRWDFYKDGVGCDKAL